MSSHRSRVFDMRRSKGAMSDYRGDPVPKSRSELSSRKKVFSSRGPPMEEKHREYMKPSKRSMEDRREYDERKPYPMVKKSRDNYQSSKEAYSRGTRDESFESKSRDPFLSRGGRDSFSGKSTRGSMSGRGSYGSSARGGRGSFGSSRGGRESYPMKSSRPQRESYPSRGSFSYPRGSRESYSSRGSFASSRGRGESFSARGRDSFSNRGREVGRGRESYPVRGRESYPTRGNEMYSGRGRENYSTRGRDTYLSRPMKLSSRGGYQTSKRISKYDDFTANSNSSRPSYHDMPKKMSTMNEDHYENERMYEMKRSSHSFEQKDSARTFKEPSSTSRSFSHHHSSSSLSHGEKFAHKRDRSSSASSHFDKERYSEHLSKRKPSKDKFASQAKRSYDEDDDEQMGHHPKDHRDGPPHKQQRLMKKEKYRESNNEEYHRTRSASPLVKEPKVREHTRERDHSKIRVQERIKKREERSSKVSIVAGEEATNAEDEGERRRVGRVKSRVISNEEISANENTLHSKVVEDKVVPLPPDDEEEEEPEESYEQRRRERSPGGGVQVTIRPDGERAVNSDGFVKSRITEKVFVDLQCPHCPDKRQISMTFMKYRYHLDSRSHRHKIEKLAYKHSIVLRRIRRQQRAEQKEIEEKWEKEKPEEFKDVISSYCKMCKLAFKSLADRVEEHNESKLHKIQQRYLHPKCEMCRMSFPSRMVYEYHIASIRHLRILSLCNKNGHDGTPEAESKDEKEEIDLTNFITMDSVGEDEEVGSEKEEITGKLEDLEKAEVDAKEVEEEEEDEHAEEEELIDREEDDDFGIDVEDERDHQQQDEEQLEPEGKDFIEPMESVYCKLCHRALRLDTEMGEDIIDKHCSSATHLQNLNFTNTEFFGGGEEQLDEEQEDLGEEEEAVADEEKKESYCGEEEEEENVEESKEVEFVAEEDEDEPNYEEVMIEHGEDIDLEDSKITRLIDVKQNGN